MSYPDALPSATTSITFPVRTQLKKLLRYLSDAKQLDITVIDLRTQVNHFDRLYFVTHFVQISMFDIEKVYFDQTKLNIHVSLN